MNTWWTCAGCSQKSYGRPTRTVIPIGAYAVGFGDRRFSEPVPLRFCSGCAPTVEIQHGSAPPDGGTQLSEAELARQSLAAIFAGLEVLVGDDHVELIQRLREIVTPTEDAAKELGRLGVTDPTDEPE